MYKLLLLFFAIYPFVIFPMDYDNSYDLIKFKFLLTSILSLWLVFLYYFIRAEIKIKFNRIDIHLTVFIVLIAISTALSIDTGLSIYGKSGRHEGLSSLIAYVSFFFLSYRFIPLGKFKILFQIILGCSFFVAIYGILQHFHLDFFPRSPEVARTIRSYGFFENPNFFGSYLVLMLLLGMTYYLMLKDGWRSISFLVINYALFLALLYSETRSGWLGSFVGFLIFSAVIFLRRKDLLKKFMILGFGFAIIFVSVNLLEGNSFLKRAGSIIEDGTSVLSGDEGRAGASRWFIWKKAMPLLDDRPFFGYGPDTFAEIFSATSEEKLQFLGGEIIVDKVHNEYLQIAITMGTPALIVYLSILYIVFRNTIIATKQTVRKEDQLLGYGFIAVIAGYAVQAFFNISVITVAPFFWMLLGLAYRYSEEIIKCKTA